ncbi:hypothetical protein KJ632_02915, partial [Patescibacteria group bacterium]|nr:hypothetical protein [Patescibacteria group bacterium]
TLDAFPLDVIFNGHVLSVNPAETVINGVIYYEAIILLDEPAEGDPLYEQYKQIKSGMTANLDILSAQAMGVLTIPPQALHYEGVETFVFVPGQAEGNGREKRIVKTGLEGEDLIEILSGLEEGQEIVLYEK